MRNRIFVLTALLLLLAGSTAYAQRSTLVNALATFLGASNAITEVSSTNPLPVTITSGTASPDTICLDGTNKDTCLARDAANTLAQKNGTAPQTFRVYGSGTKYAVLKHDGSGTLLTTVAASGPIDIRTADADDVWLGVSGGRKWQIAGSSGHLLAVTDNANDVGSSNAARPRALFLAQPSITAASGTGITLIDSGSVRSEIYKIRVTNAAWSTAALTADATIGTLPAKTILKRMWVDVTTKFIGGAVSAAAMTCGTAAGGAQYIASFDIFTNPITRGLADADMGTLLVRAAAIQGGTMASFSATQIVTCRVTTVTANTNALTQGTADFYLETAVLP